MKEFMVKDLVWTRPPRQFTISDEEITITTEPKTDLWQKTYYHFVNDNAPVLQMETEEDYFSFTVKTDFAGSHTRFDQCGIVLYQDSENWLKCSIEYENDDFQHFSNTWEVWLLITAFLTGQLLKSVHKSNPCGLGSVAGELITALKIPKMVSTSNKCGFAIFIKGRGK